jgi:hypothetical protein
MPIENRYVGIIILTMLLLAGATCVVGQGAGRDLPAYSMGPETDLYPYLAPPAEDEIALRNFVYDAWIKKKRSFVKINYYSREGRRSPCTYFIEPENNGKWVVISECLGECMWVSKKACDERLPTVNTFDVVEKSRNVLSGVIEILLKSSINGQTDRI